MKGMATSWMIILIISLLAAVAAFIIIFATTGNFAQNLFGGLKFF